MKLPLILLTILNMHTISKDLHNHNSLMESTCLTLNTPNYQLCVSSLRSSPYSSEAQDVEELCLVLIETIRSVAETALSRIDRLKRQHPELERCRNAYKAVIEGDVQEALSGLVKGLPKFAEDAMNDVAWEAEICEDYLMDDDGDDHQSPLSGINKYLHDLALVTAHIIRNNLL